MEILFLIIGAIISLILSLIFIPLLQDRVTDYCVELLGDIPLMRKSESLSGDWEQNWQVDGVDNSIKHNNKKLILHQLGKSVVGKFYYDNRAYIIRARVENNAYISGTWFDEKSGQVYYGAFQARIEVYQKEVNGIWIGFSRSHNKINTGSWKWSRCATSLH